MGHVFIVIRRAEKQLVHGRILLFLLFPLYGIALPARKDAQRKRKTPIPEDGRREYDQPLTAPAVTPSMNWLCARKKTIRLGMMEIRETAMTRFHAKPVSASMLMRTNSVAG